MTPASARVLNSARRTSLNSNATRWRRVIPSCARAGRSCWRTSSINIYTDGNGESMKSKLIPLLLIVMTFGCNKEPEPAKPAEKAEAKKEASVTKSAFGNTPENEAVDLFTLTNANGVEAKIISYGGIVISLRVPDRSGKFADIAL